MPSVNEFNERFIDEMTTNLESESSDRDEDRPNVAKSLKRALSLSCEMPVSTAPVSSRTEAAAVPNKIVYYRTDFERLRQDGLWDKIGDLAEQQKSHPNGTSTDPLVHFYQGEARLESVVDAIHMNKMTTLTDETKKALVDVKKYFEQLLKSSLPAEIVRLIRFLIGKTCFLLADLNECVISLEKGYLNDADLSQEANRRNLKIYAEAFCLRGMCMSAIPIANGKVKRTERMEKLMVNFEVANDLTLRCTQTTDMIMKEGRDIAGTLADLAPFQLGDLLENALARTPNMYAKHGMLASALVRFRDTLRTVETPGTRKARLTLARQLLEMLLRGYLGVHYIDPRMTERHTSAGASANISVSRPRKYVSNGSFIPLALLEEVILLLYICEAVIVRDLASRSSEDPEVRKLLLMNAVAVADLATIAFSRLYHISLGVPFLERASKSCPSSIHIWKHFALNLIVKGDYAKGLQVIEQCFRFIPKDRTLLIFAAKVCVDHVMELEQGIHFAEALLKISEKTRFSGRAHLILGVAHSLKAERTRDYDKQLALRTKAINYYLQAESEEPGDFLIHYHLALEYCIDRKIDEAYKHIKKCLRMNLDFLPAHHLLAIILSCLRRYDDGLKILEKAEMEFAEDIEMELTKIRLQAKIRGCEAALKSCRHLMWTWKSTYERDMQDAERDRLRTVSPDAPYPVSPAYANQLSPLPLQFPQNSLTVSTNSKISPSTPGVLPSDKTDTMSYRTESAATMPRTEGTMSELASTTGSYMTRTAAHRAYTTQLHIWVLMAELYLSMELVDNALECLTEAANIGPPSHLIFFLQGTISLKKKLTAEAKKFFEGSLAVNPWHSPSHIQLGLMQRKDNCDAEAERHFREALKCDPCSHEAWSALGDLYIQKGNDEAAMEYLDRARRMEISDPIQPVYNLPRCVSY